jgi:hypothetical protein
MHVLVIIVLIGFALYRIYSESTNYKSNQPPLRSEPENANRTNITQTTNDRRQINTRTSIPPSSSTASINPINSEPSRQNTYRATSNRSGVSQTIKRNIFHVQQH